MKRRHLWLDILAAAIVVAGVTGLVIFMTAGDEGDEPTPFPSASLTVEPTASPTPSRSPSAGRVWQPWPTYGYDRARTRYNPALKLRPPFRIKWKVEIGDLLEFPPAVDERGRLYICAGHGFVYCFDGFTGERLWRYGTKGKLASTPTSDRDSVYVSSMAGKLVVLNRETGRLRWQYRGTGITESSPLVWKGRVFFGSRNGSLYALSTRTHKLVWRYQADGRLNGAPAMLNDRIVIAGYDGVVYCLTYDGRLIWKRDTGRMMAATDPFYATPALAYNTVYIGSIGRHVFAFDLGNGGTRWTFAAGGWVYSSAAVCRGIVYVGSYDNYLYALNAANGKVVWRFRASGPISGAVTVIDRVVYFSTIRKHTWALDARSGKVLWQFRDGVYTPVTASRKMLFFAGSHTLYGMVEKK